MPTNPRRRTPRALVPGDSGAPSPLPAGLYDPAIRTGHAVPVRLKPDDDPDFVHRWARPMRSFACGGKAEGRS